MISIQKINENIKQALINRDNRVKNLWRNVKAKAEASAKEAHSETSDSICASAVKAELKQLEQTLAAVPSNSTLAAETKANIEELTQYLPKQLSDEELKHSVRAIVMSLPGGTPFGYLMKECMKQLGDIADGKRISEILKSL